MIRKTEYMIPRFVRSEFPSNGFGVIEYFRRKNEYNVSSTRQYSGSGHSCSSYYTGCMGFIRIFSLNAEMFELKSSADAAALVIERIGAVEIELAQSLDAPNVARNPADFPPPITRTEPMLVEITLTTKELTAELADGTTYTFWTFDGTVPGPMVRVMEGDTVQVTLVNPPESKMPHNYRLGCASQAIAIQCLKIGDPTQQRFCGGIK